MTARGKRSVGPRPLRARLYVVPLLLAIVTAASCSSDDAGSDQPESRREFRAEFEELSGPLTDTEYREVVQLAEDTCADDADVFALTYAMLVDGGGPSAEGFRLQVEHFCPDRLDELEP